MTISDVHDTIYFFERKERLSLHTHSEIDKTLDMVQMQAVSESFKNYGVNQPNLDYFKIIKTTLPFTANDSGLIALPTDYLHLTRIQTHSYDCKRARPIITDVKMVKDDQLSNALNSQLRPVTREKPIGVMAENAIRLYPGVAQAGVLVYIRRPKVPKYAYVQDGRKITYNPEESQDLEFGDDVVVEIIKRALFILGVNLQDQTLIQASLQNTNP